MQIETVIAVAIAPLLYPVYRWVFLTPGRLLHDYLWVRMPDGWLRNILLRPINRRSAKRLPSRATIEGPPP